MEQSSEAAQTPSSENVEATETIVLKKPAAVVESSAKPEEADEKESIEVVTTVKVEKKTTDVPATENVTETESETEEVIVEEVEESEEEETSEIVQKPAIDSAEKTETVAAVDEAVTVKANVAVAEKKVPEPSEEEEEVEEEVEEEEEDEKAEEEAVKKEVVKEEAAKESKEVPKAESENKDERDASQTKVETTVQQESLLQLKQENVNNTIKEIISDIDSNIREQERIARLKQEEQKLLQKQHELEQQIEEQQLLAQRLVSHNERLQQQQYQQQPQQQPQQPPQQQPQQPTQQNNKFESTQQVFPPQSLVSRYSTFEETKDGNTITKTTSSYETAESSNVTKRIDLKKIFTPATDAEEILPRNRKLYASSAFYTPGLHPTVEDQVELARRISHSLSDISNHQSKGQSMYSNRKKRSVKWVHEGQGEEEEQVEEICEEQYKENAEQQSDTKLSQTLDKLPLRLLMNPRGQVLDYNSLRDSLNVDSGLLSPEKCAELVHALQTQKGRGAELFAKRRKKSDKWIVDEQNASTQNPSGLPDFTPYQGQVPPKPPTSPSILPAYSDAGKHRVQLNLHQEQVLEKYARPGLQVVKSPWEAALETGSASAAFVEGGRQQHAMTPTPSPAPIYDTVHNSNAYNAAPAPEIQQTYQQPKYSKPSSYNDHQKDLAYKPSLPQGWKAPSVSLPKELYMPKEIPLESYAPPPVMNLKPSTTSTYSPLYQTQEPPYTWTPALSSTPPTISPSPYNDYSYSKPAPVVHNTSTFPLTKKSASARPQYGGGGSSFPVSANVPPKQQYWEPTSYQKVQDPSAGHKVPHVNFNPSPLSYDKLAMFENPDNSADVYPQQRHLAPSHRHGSRVRNISPAPFAAKSPASSPYSPPMQQYSNYGSTSYSPSIPSSTPTYGHHNPNELLHGPTFNNAARGWNSSGGVHSFYAKPRAPLTTGGQMPYTDF